MTIEYRRDDSGAVVIPDREVRAVAKVELRDAGDAGRRIEGYATVYDYPYEIGDVSAGGFTERISRDAASKSAREADVPLLLNHQGIALARTRSGTLEIESDDVGLRIAATLDERNPFSAAAMSALDRGDIDEMSFAFRALRQQWNDDYTERTISEVKLIDVTLANKGANPATLVRVADAPTPAATAAGRSLTLARRQYEALNL